MPSLQFKTLKIQSVTTVPLNFKQVVFPVLQLEQINVIVPQEPRASERQSLPRKLKIIPVKNLNIQARFNLSIKKEKFKDKMFSSAVSHTSPREIQSCEAKKTIFTGI